MLSAEEVKARATSPIEACKVSLEVWRDKAQGDLKDVPMGHGHCGLCLYYGLFSSGIFMNCKADKGECPLSFSKADGQACTPEYSYANSLLERHKQGAATVAQVRSAFWAMVARLEKELVKLEAEEKTKQEAEKQATKKPERVIRHGELMAFLESGEPPVPRLVLNRNGRLHATGPSGATTQQDVEQFKDCYAWLDINIFDVMAKAMKGEKEYRVFDVEFKLVNGVIWINDRYSFGSHEHVMQLLQAVVSLAIQRKLAEAQK